MVMMMMMMMMMMMPQPSQPSDDYEMMIIMTMMTVMMIMAVPKYHHLQISKVSLVNDDHWGNIGRYPTSQKSTAHVELPL